MHDVPNGGYHTDGKVKLLRSDNPQTTGCHTGTYWPYSMQQINYYQ